jgi:hypothetical protein|tara:strand:- start:2946 stop:3263 length:318 start_codon:yes stop_codon:yes gene_type:complete
MAIKPPAWAKGAHPTISGWMKGRELLVAKTISQSDIDEWNGTLGQPVPPAPKPEPEPVVVVEEDFSEIENMSKRELEEFARTKGVELDRRQSKRSLLTIVKDVMK